MSTLFQSLDNLMSEGTVLSITIQKQGGRLICSILPKNQDVKDDAAKKLIPLAISATAFELDEGFINAISTPLEKACGVLSNLADFERSSEAAAKNNKKAEADKKKFDQLIKKADQLEKDKKQLNAIACLKQALEYATNKKQIEDRIKKIEASANQNTIFGNMDTEDPVRENYLDDEPETVVNEDNEDNENDEEGE